MRSAEARLELYRSLTSQSNDVSQSKEALRILADHSIDQAQLLTDLSADLASSASELKQAAAKALGLVITQDPCVTAFIGAGKFQGQWTAALLNALKQTPDKEVSLTLLWALSRNHLTPAAIIPHLPSLLQLLIVRKSRRADQAARQMARNRAIHAS
ncbi:hypothetical protein WJX73_008321 [Symbiochloris irregularis]|uniref:HEAT repeat domain-containing protein n=1 Tax=Symbiochloris irregularis TaxID=706552 RepID=A0AAW1P8I8_9CHLO